MKGYVSILVVMIAAVLLLAAAVPEQGHTVSVNCGTGQEILVMNGTPVALPRNEGRENPWIRLDGGEELLSGGSMNSLRPGCTGI